MKIEFEDKRDGVWFEYSDTPAQLPLKKCGKVNLTGLYLYGMYRNTIYDSYKEKPDLAEDIKVYPKVFNEHPSRFHDPLYNTSLYHYSVDASLAAVNEWLNQNEKVKSYFAYELASNTKSIGAHRKIVGFVHFTEKQLDGENIVYIAQAGVIHRSSGIGKRLMDCVLSHYPENTHFKILTRIFNHNAKTLYNDKLHFSPISSEEVRQFGYDQRYCGFKHTTSVEEIQLINKNKTTIGDVPSDEQKVQAISFRGFK